MHNFDNEIYHIWRPELDEVVQYAIRQKSTVEIRSHLPLDECNFADVLLYGRFLAVNNFQAQFLVEDYDLSPTKNFPAAPECEYSFSANINITENGRARMEYGGRATILDTELQKNNIPAGLLLRVFLPTSIRRLRLHERHDCPSERIIMPGLMLIDAAPITRRKLLALLGHYYQDKKRPRPQLVNISAGGVCLQTEDQRCQRFMGTDESYLFFFFSADNDNLACPHVFICRKVGLFRGCNTRHAGLRIRFTRELIWQQPEDDLRWIDIESDGSDNLRRILQEKKG